MDKGRDDLVEEKTNLHYDEDDAKNPAIGRQSFSAPLKSWRDGTKPYAV